MLSLLHDLFKKSNLSNAFDEELAIKLKKIPEDEIPSNFTSFYNKNKEPEKTAKLKIKFNNKVFHQSKVLNYFQNKTVFLKLKKKPMIF